MSGQEKYYKVVTFKNDKYYSSMYNEYELFNLDEVRKEIILEYKVDEWTKPIINNSKLFVFDNLSSAIHFKSMLDHLNLLIFNCDVKNPAPLKNRAGAADIPAILDFWNMPNECFNLRNWMFDTPPNTFGVDELKLLRVV